MILVDFSFLYYLSSCALEIGNGYVKQSNTRDSGKYLY